MRRDFVANVSHELKTPITSIKGFVETLLEGALEDPSSARKFLEIIARQADRLNQIIDDLLTLSRIEREAQDPHVLRESGSLHGVLQAAVDDCQRLLKQRKSQIALQCPRDLEVSMNAQLIEQAVVNLLDNAIKYSPPSSSIELTASRQDEWVVVEVKDHGSGIGPEHLGRIFERFYRVDKARSREQGGTGLGLAIVKHIAQAHSGKVSVQSTLGKGSTFTVHLPARDGPGE
jgi:two-component system phosphate regulon sensor histidine kinase PhoR